MTVPLNIQRAIIYSSIVLLLSVINCTPENDEGIITLPSNLTIQVTTTTDGSGNVTVQATATKANFFTIMYGDKANDSGIVSKDGKGTHTYTSSGTFTIKVQAHTTQEYFIDQTKTVAIELAGSNGFVPIPTTGTTSPVAYEGKTLVWQDEFEGTSLDATKWNFETGYHPFRGDLVEQETEVLLK